MARLYTHISTVSRFRKLKPKHPRDEEERRLHCPLGGLSWVFVYNYTPILININSV